MSRVQLVWFKRDLRVRDHRPLVEAARRGPVVCLYVHEPELLAGADAHPCQTQFVEESLRELAGSLEALGGRLLVRAGALPEVFDRLFEELPFSALWSHEETGNLLSYARDRRVRRWCRARGVAWQELPQNGVIRALKERTGWSARWHERMSAPILLPPRRIQPPEGELPGLDPPQVDMASLGLSRGSRPGAQPGGEAEGWARLRSFLRVRGVDYTRAMSSPVTAWEGCSRISPHLAWGTLSLKQVFQATCEQQRRVAEAGRAGAPVDPRWARSLASFQSRLRWHCHFIQKLEREPELEIRNANRAYDGLREEELDPALFEAWAQGRTGWPMVDACMRCLHETGWINFRMRAMLVSVAAYPLWLHWRPVALHLARLFVDYEPGIHYSQVQMQSGVTGINTLRIYNPTRQAREHDPQGVFLRRWLPELEAVPLDHLHEPWRMPPLLQQLCGVEIGRDYPEPVVDFLARSRAARARVAAVRGTAAGRAEAARVFREHGSRKRPAPRGGRRPGGR